LTEVKRVYHTLGEQDIFDEQTEVIKKINTDLSKNTFGNFVSNYKTLATISQMFSSRTPISRRVILEDTLVENMMLRPTEVKEMKPIDSLTYRMFVKKFNEKYGNSLNESQKTLLSKYIVLSPETSTEFKMYINDEIDRLKEVVRKIQEKREVLLDESLSNKNKEVLDILDGFKQKRISDEMIKTILKIQSLTTEV